MRLIPRFPVAVQRSGLTVALAAAGVCAVVLATAAPSQAQFLNNTVTIDYLFPNTGSVFQSSGPLLVTAGGVNFASSTGATGRVTATQFTVLIDSDSTFSTVPFNGFRVRDTNGTIPAIAGFSIDSSTIPGLDASRVSFDADNLFVNLQGLNTTSGQSSVINVQFAGAAAPEPGTLPLVGMGLLTGAGVFSRRREMMGSVRRRRKATKQAA